MESRLQCGGATSDVDDRVVYASLWQAAIIFHQVCSYLPSHRHISSGDATLHYIHPSLCPRDDTVISVTLIVFVTDLLN